MNVELELPQNQGLEKDFSKILENEKINNELLETLKSADLTLKMYLKNDNTIGIQKIEEPKVTNEKEKSISSTKSIHGVNKELTLNKAENMTDIVMQKVDAKPKKRWVRKAMKVALRVGEELLDNVARETLKKKFKWNYSVYNDAKSSVIAIRNKDYRTAVEKGTDSIIYAMGNKQIPAATKKIMKNTKNAAIEELFSGMA